jgi:hypothetical protein
VARSHAKFYVRAWRDEEWRDLGMAAQWLYWLLLSQPRLTLVGSLEVQPGKWSHLASRLTKADVQHALDELVIAGKVLIDEATEELLIRAFTKNDLDPNRVNVNLAKGLWGQWACLESHPLRIAAVDGMPDDLWDKLGRHAPPDAVDIRRSARLEPDDRTGDSPPVGTTGSDAWIEPPPSSRLSTDTSHRPAAAVTNPQARGLELDAAERFRRMGVA